MKTRGRTEMKYAPSFQRLLEFAAYDCAQRGSDAVGVDHLVLGLYREDFPLIDEVLATFQVDSLVVLDRFLRAHPEAARPTRPEAVRLSPEALRAIALAEHEAERLGHDLLTPPHTLLGVLEHDRDRLERYFIREEIYRRREDEVLKQVRELVRWLRFDASGGVSRELDVIDSDTLVGVESMRLRSPDRQAMKGFAVRLRMLKAFHAR